MNMFNNRELISMTKEITVAFLAGGNLANKSVPAQLTADVMQAVYDKLAELNSKSDQ